MLRIDKKKEILVRKKETFFSATLFKGLGIAVAFHLLFFLFFKISWVLDPEELPFLEPVSVEIDLSYEPQVIQVPMTSKEITLKNREFPTLLEMPLPNLVIEKSAFQERFDKEADFSEIETIEYEPFNLEDT